MSLVLGDNFSYQGAKPLDKRNQYDTVAAMVAVSDTVLYDGCLTYCLETGKTYQWLSTNTVDATLGKWREFAGGGSGSSDLAGLDDVDITAAAAGQILKYDETEQKWVNSNQTLEIVEMSKAEFDALSDSEKNNGKAYFIPDAQGSEGGGGTTDYNDLDNKPSINNVALFGNKSLSDLGIQEQYTAGDGIDITDGKISTKNMLPDDMAEVASPMPGVMSRRMKYSLQEQVVGEWIDGKSIYQKTWTGLNITLKANNWYNTQIDATNLVPINGFARCDNTSDNFVFFPHIRNSNNTMQLMYTVAIGTITTLTVQYTKTTDTAS